MATKRSQHVCSGSTSARPTSPAAIEPAASVAGLRSPSHQGTVSGPGRQCWKSINPPARLAEARLPLSGGQALSRIEALLSQLVRSSRADDAVEDCCIALKRQRDLCLSNFVVPLRSRSEMGRAGLREEQ